MQTIGKIAFAVLVIQCVATFGVCIWSDVHRGETIEWRAE